METRKTNPLARQEVKELQKMPVPKFRAWMFEYSKQVFDLGFEECKEILRLEFGFGEKRLKRFDDAMMDLQREIAGRRDDG